MKKLIALAALVSCSAAFSGFASAACTQEEVMQKIQDIQTKMQALASKDPQKLQKLSTDMQTKATELAKDPSPDAACAYYDEVLKQL